VVQILTISNASLGSNVWGGGPTGVLVCTNGGGSSATSPTTSGRSAARKVYFSLVRHVAAQKPDKLRVITPGEGTPDDFYYDGKTMMVYVPGQELVAVVEAPPTIGAVGGGRRPWRRNSGSRSTIVCRGSCASSTPTSHGR